MSSSWTVYLMRHGEAAWTSPDSERALTVRGRDQTQQVLASLGSRVQRLQKVLASPYQRARQTAAEVEASTGLHASLHDFLTPDEPVYVTLESLIPYMGDQSIIVAHQPLLGNLVSLLTAGNLEQPYPFATSEIVQLDMELWAPGCARIVTSWHPTAID
jgi:phosphohistidine phosphatase